MNKNKATDMPICSFCFCCFAGVLFCFVLFLFLSLSFLLLLLLFFFYRKTLSSKYRLLTGKCKRNKIDFHVRTERDLAENNLDVARKAIPLLSKTFLTPCFEVRFVVSISI